MIICIPAETSGGIKSKIFNHFGSAPYFTIYDDNIKNFKVDSTTTDTNLVFALTSISNVEVWVLMKGLSRTDIINDQEIFFFFLREKSPGRYVQYDCSVTRQDNPNKCRLKKGTMYEI